MTAMFSSRRRLIRSVAGGALALGAGGFIPRRVTATGQGGARVIVRAGGELRAFDPQTRSVRPWSGAMPAAAASPEAIPAPVPAAIATLVTEGAVGYWMASPDANAFVFRIDTGASSIWWWVGSGDRASSLALPGDLEPAFPNGTAARWFHGATVDAEHLGAGTLRLLAVDIATGEIALDHELDRRLELAATAVSDEGAIVAHIQSSTTGVAFWAADLRGGTRIIEAGVTDEPGKAAASAIELDVATDGETVLIAAGLVRDWPGAPSPTVSIMRAPSAFGITTLPGELIGIISDTNSGFRAGDPAYGRTPCPSRP